MDTPKTPEDLVDVKTSPGAEHVFGTDAGGHKRWRPDTEIVANAAPLVKEFSTPASTWPWNHGLGFRPIVEAYNTSWELLLAYIVHTDENNLSAQHTYNATGWLVIR